jgi:hypothetical protein
MWAKSIIKSTKGKFFIPWEPKHILNDEGQIVLEAEEQLKELTDEEEKPEEIPEKFWKKNIYKKKKKKKADNSRKGVMATTKNRDRRQKKFEKNKWKSVHNIVESNFPGFELEDMCCTAKEVNFLSAIFLP